MTDTAQKTDPPSEDPPAASRKRDIHPLIRFNYLPRIFGYALFLVIFITLFHDRPSPFLWAAVMAQTLLWPHVAYLLGKKSRTPRQAEYRNMIFEAFLIGLWMTKISFNLLPCSAFFIGGALNLMATGGIRLFFKGIFSVLTGITLAGLFVGFQFDPETSLATTVACVFTILSYASTISYLSFVYSKKLSDHKHSLEKAHDDIKEKLMITEQEIHERKQVEKRLQDAMQKAEAASREKSRFLATMSHEIRTPMNAIIGMTELALQTENPQDIHGYLATVRDSSTHLLAIINDILDFSKIESGKFSLERRDFNLTELLERVVDTFRHDADKKNLFLESTVDPKVPDHINGDPARIRQVLVNIIGNALKFTHQGGITITLKQSPQASGNEPLLFAVTDSGIGISDDQKDFIFERFSQADHKTSHVYGGTGLGLSICKKIVELMGGRIWFESEEGRGTTFFFTLPLCPAVKPEKIPAPDGPDTAQTLRKLSILLAEDHPINIELTTIVLKGLGHDVAVAQNGIEAVDMVKNGAFDLVLMDIEMPEMDGLEASTRIRNGQAGSEKADTPIIAMTAHAFDDMVLNYKKAGINHAISKPINIHTLGAIIQEVIDTHTAKG
jgi:signal transduction histidine kinase/ActR/RegA family two-component response regulator